jgi:hypothetical protein
VCTLLQYFLRPPHSSKKSGLFQLGKVPNRF